MDLLNEEKIANTKKRLPKVHKNLVIYKNNELISIDFK